MNTSFPAVHSWNWLQSKLNAPHLRRAYLKHWLKHWCVNWRVFGVLSLSAKIVVRMLCQPWIIPLCHAENKFPLAEESKMDRMNGRHHTGITHDLCLTAELALEEDINITTLLIISSATFKSCLNNRFLFQLCVYVQAWLVIKIYTYCKEEVFWLDGTFASLCVTMGFHSFVLPQFYCLVLFSQFELLQDFSRNEEILGNIGYLCQSWLCCCFGFPVHV